MNVYVFSSKNLTNIWAGIGAGVWALPEDQAAKVGGAAAKAAKMHIGCFGIMYCSDEQVQSLTTPFVVLGRPEERTVVDVWDTHGTLPFKIRPLGTPERRVHKVSVRRTPSGRPASEVVP